METISENKWNQYRRVQDGGRYNMFDPRAKRLTTLTRREWVTIMENYSDLKDKYEPEEK